MSPLPYKNVKVTEREKGEVEITAEVPVEALKDARKKAIAEISKDVKVDGFRAGKVPEKVIVERFGELTILERAAESILPEITYQILVTEKIDSIGRPNITITKMALDADLEFKIVTTLFPKITEFPDYKKIAEKAMKEKEDDVTVTDKEIESVVLEVRKSRVSKEIRAKLKDGEEIPESDLPAFTDELVQSLGDFKNIEDFKEKVRDNMKAEKESKNKEKRRLKILDGISAGTHVVIPELLVQNELEKMWAQFNDDIVHMGLTIDKYLEHIKKSKEELKKEWVPDAEKKAKLQLIMDHIATLEKLEADKDLVEKETKHLMEHYSEALPDRARSYIMMVLTNEAVFQFLEKQK